MRCVLCLFISFITATVYAGYFDTPATGWHWNTPVVHKKTMTKKQRHLSPTQTMTAFQAYFNNVKNDAVLHPTPTTVLRYLRLQQLIAHQSTQFARVALSVVRTHPALNYDLHNPTNSATQQVIEHEKSQQQSRVAHALAQQYGLILVYRGHNRAAFITAQTVRDLSKQYGFAVRGITVDHVAFPILPKTIDNHGQAEALGVKATPAIFLVSPRTHQFVLLRYGYPSQNELLDDMVRVTGEQR